MPRRECVSEDRAETVADEDDFLDGDLGGREREGPGAELENDGVDEFGLQRLLDFEEGVCALRGSGAEVVDCEGWVALRGCVAGG